LRLKVYSSHYALDLALARQLSGTGFSDLLSGSGNHPASREGWPSIRSFQRDRHLRWLKAWAFD